MEDGWTSSKDLDISRVRAAIVAELELIQAQDENSRKSEAERAMRKLNARGRASGALPSDCSTGCAASCQSQWRGHGVSQTKMFRQLGVRSASRNRFEKFDLGDELSSVRREVTAPGRREGDRIHAARFEWVISPWCAISFCRFCNPLGIVFAIGALHLLCAMATEHANGLS